MYDVLYLVYLCGGPHQGEGGLSRTKQSSPDEKKV